MKGAEVVKACLLFTHRCHFDNLVVGAVRLMRSTDLAGDPSLRLKNGSAQDDVAILEIQTAPLPITPSP